MFIKMKKPHYLQPHCKMSIVLAFPTVGHSPSTVLFVPSSPGNSQKPRLNQRSSTPTCLSSTCHGSNKALCTIPTRECENGTPPSPKGYLHVSGVYFCFPQNRTTPCMLALSLHVPSVSPTGSVRRQTSAQAERCLQG